MEIPGIVGLQTRLDRGLANLSKDTQASLEGMTPQQVNAYIAANSSPVRLRTIGEVYATHPDAQLRALSDLAFRKLAEQYDTEITSSGSDL